LTARRGEAFEACDKPPEVKEGKTVAPG